MQLTKIHTKIIQTILLSLLFLSSLVLQSFDSAGAQYNRGTYGSCEYGVSCPDDTSEPGGNSPSEGSPPGGNSIDNTDPGGDNSDSAPGGGGQDSSNGSGGSSDNESVPGSQNNGGDSSSTDNNYRESIKDKPRIIRDISTIIRELTPTQQALLPYYSWLWLIILGIILLIQAYIDKRKVNRLKKSLSGLDSTINEQKNFIHLMLHHLNTPLALIKNSIELLETAQPSEQDAIQILRPAGLELDATIQNVTTADLEVRDNATITNEIIPKGIQATSWKDRLFYILPITFSVILGVVLTYFLYQADVVQPVHKIQYQIAIAAMSSLIFVNALRIFRVSRLRVKVLKQIEMLSMEIETKRRDLVMRLSNNLSSVAQKLDEGQRKVNNTKYRRLVNNSAVNISRLFVRTWLAVNNLSKTVNAIKLGETIEKILQKNQVEIDAKKLRIVKHIDIPEVLLSYVSELEVGVETLVENAVQYATNEGTINIVAGLGQDSVWVSVEDNGPGMSDDELKNAFVPFYQSEDVITFDHGGASISLYAIKKAFERLGGSVTIESSKNKGTKAIIVMPTKQQLQPEMSQQPSPA